MMYCHEKTYSLSRCARWCDGYGYSFPYLSVNESLFIMIVVTICNTVTLRDYPLINAGLVVTRVLHTSPSLP